MELLIGDGSSKSSPTSHIYTFKGAYTVTLTVDCRADYSFGDQGWRPIEGIVSVPSAPFTVVAKESTVLVAQDCNAEPTSPAADVAAHFEEPVRDEGTPTPHL